jgi:GNAT superfamily N-acetyltransferase
MDISQAKANDLIEVMYLLKVCVQDLYGMGLGHTWDTIPTADQIEKDLEAGAIYLVKDKGVCKGMIMLFDREPVDYRQLNLTDANARPLFMRCMAVHPQWRRQGIGKRLMEFAQNKAKSEGFTCIRLDVHPESEDARKLYENYQFSEIGKFHTDYQKTAYICYEKSL